MQKRALFATKLGVIATSVGSAVGLGNIWRFPYEVGVHGGGAFIFVYIICIILIGIPAICAELFIGKKTHKNQFGAMRELSNNTSWKWISVMGIIISLMILSFYSVVSGWTLEYLYESATGNLFRGTTDQYATAFDSFTANPYRPLIMTLIFLGVNHLIIVAGVRKGIERASNIAMPLLFILLLVFCINSLLLPGASDGLKFLFQPDFSQINADMVLGAMGQAFFSLSIGHGCLLTYASYFPDDTPIVRTSVSIAGLDTMVAIMAGIIIFPILFTFQGGDFVAGPKLVFEVLPNVFSGIAGGSVLSVLFFLLLLVASMTSTIAISEISISFFMEEFNLSRRWAASLNTLIAVVFGSLCALSFGPLQDYLIGDMTIFDMFNHVSSDILLPITGFLYVVFVAWRLKRSMVREQLLVKGSNGRVTDLLMFCMKYITPVAILFVFLYSMGIIK